MYCLTRFKSCYLQNQFVIYTHVKNKILNNIKLYQIKFVAKQQNRKCLWINWFLFHGCCLNFATFWTFNNGDCLKCVVYHNSFPHRAHLNTVIIIYIHNYWNKNKSVYMQNCSWSGFIIENFCMPIYLIRNSQLKGT